MANRLFAFALAASACLLSSCVRERELTPHAGNTPITVEVEEPRSVPDATRSSYTEEDLNRISDLNILVYHGGVLLPRCSRYFSPAENISIDLPTDRDGFNIYMLGNVGDVTGRAPADESAMESFRHVAQDYREFRTKGFPVANRFTDFRRGSPTRFKVKRLVGQYSITLRTTSQAAEYTVTSASLHNCALDVYPFMDPSRPVKASAFSSGGDALSADDVARLNAGEPVDLYFIENLQGTLLPANTDPKNKGPQNDRDPIWSKCTYLEIRADVKTPAASYEDGVFRYFLGSDATTNFDIRRATRYILNISMASDMMNDEGWRVEVEPPTVTGRLDLDKRVASVIRGVEDGVRITPHSGNHADLEYTVEYVQQGVVNGVMTRSTLPASAVRVEPPRTFAERGTVILTTDRPISGRVPLGMKPSPCGCVVLAVRTVDKHNGNSILTENIRVDVYDKSWPIVFKKRNNRMYVYAENPLGLPLMVGVRTKTGTKYTDRYVFLDGRARYRATGGGWYTVDDRSAALKGNTSLAASGVAEDVGPITDVPCNAGIVSPDWSKFNLISDYARSEVFVRKGRQIDFWIDFEYGSGGTSVRSLRCTDGTRRSLDLAYRDSGFPRWAGGDPLGLDGGVKQMQSVLGNTLGPEQYQNPHRWPKVADKVNLWIGGGAGSGYFDVSADGSCAGANGHIRNLQMMTDYSVFRSGIFSECNRTEAPSAGSPFYVANGIQLMYKIFVYNDDPSRVGDSHRALKGFEAFFHGPGRDLGDAPAREHHAAYLTNNQKQAGNNYNRWFHDKWYTTNGGEYLTVNGYTCWPYGDTTPEGVKVPSSIGYID